MFKVKTKQSILDNAINSFLSDYFFIDASSIEFFSIDDASIKLSNQNNPFKHYNYNHTFFRSNSFRCSIFFASKNS